MYYNIKIKANDSELSLESDNKSVTQREMDIYFAHFFNASESFKSKIKKIVLTSDEVKSIDEIQDVKKDDTIKTASFEIQGNSIPQEQKPLVQIAQQENQNIQEEIQSTQEEQKAPEIFQFEEEKVLSYKQYQKQQQQIEANKEESELIFVGDAPNYNPENTVVETIKTVEEVEADKKVTAGNTDKTEKLDEIDKVLGSIFNNSLTPKEESKNDILDAFSTKSESIMPDVTQRHHMTVSLPNISEQNSTRGNSDSDREKDILNYKIRKLSDRFRNVSFNIFLNEYFTDNLYDEFIICAFYIRNILDQGTFSMKFINSNIFQATGQIAGLSILNALINKGYIKVVDSDDSTRYTITCSGEEYFINKFQS